MGEGKHPTPTHSSHSVPPKWGRKKKQKQINQNLRNPCEFQCPVTKRQKPNHSTIEYFLYPVCHHCSIKSLRQFPLSNTSCPMTEKKLQGIPYPMTKDKRHNLKTTCSTIRQARDTGILKPGIFKQQLQLIC